jgi:hypothetical protein
MFLMEMFVFFRRDGYVPQGVPMKMFLMVVFLGEMPMFPQETVKKWLCCFLELPFFKF